MEVKGSSSKEEEKPLERDKDIFFIDLLLQDHLATIEKLAFCVHWVVLEMGHYFQVTF